MTTYAVRPAATDLVIITQTTTYVNGAQQFRVRWDVTNLSGAPLGFKALVAADFYSAATVPVVVEPGGRSSSPSTATRRSRTANTTLAPVRGRGPRAAVSRRRRPKTIVLPPTSATSDPLRAFGEACRAELKSMRGKV